jgi:acetyl-CoA carboxylase carboxyltransferase component
VTAHPEAVGSAEPGEHVTPDDDLRRRLEHARKGGDARYHAKLREQNKLFVRDRLDRVLDPGWTFEDGLLARHVDGNLPADAVVTVVGTIDRRPVCVIANDMTVKAGTWGYRTFQKITAMQELAGRTRCPLLYLIDSAGARIDEQRMSYAGRKAWGNIFYNQIQLSGVVPQVCVLLGPSPAGTAYQPALCDVVIMVEGNATAYIGSPRMSEMATGEKVTMEEMGGAEMHARVSGLGDFLCKDEDEALAVAKQYLSYFPSHWSEKPPMHASAPPASGKTIAEIVPTSQRIAFNIVDLIKALVDDGSWLEVKKLWARELVTGYARLGGRPVGIVANQSRYKGGVLFPDSSDKAARFIWTCNAFNVPLLFLQDIPGFMVGSQVERAGMIRHGAKMLFAVAEARVPRIAVLVRKAYGGGYLAMSGSPMNPDAVLALPTAKPALMGPESAINAIYLNKIMELPEEQRAAFIDEKRREYEEDIDVYEVASDFSLEAVIPSDELRDELIRRYEIYCRKDVPPPSRRNGVMPV